MLPKPATVAPTTTAKPKPTEALIPYAARCDRCGSRAYAMAYIGDWPTPLYLCGHHFREHEAALRALTDAIVDETSRLVVEAQSRKAPGSV